MEFITTNKRRFDLIDEADEYYFAAMKANNKTTKKKLLNKAVEICEFHWDAHLQLILFEKDLEKKYKKLLKLEPEVRKDMLENEDVSFEEDMGSFYSILETRPYIRVLYSLFINAIEINRFRSAFEIGKNILALNESDNTGVRYFMCPLCVLLEETEELEKIDKFYDAGYAANALALYYHYRKLGKKTKANNVLKDAHSYEVDELCDIYVGVKPPSDAHDLLHLIFMPLMFQNEYLTDQMLERYWKY